jgi:hypothetical protein
MIVGFLVLVGLVCGAAVLRRRRRRTVYLRMSDAWVREHVDDPLPDHLA